jgi:3-deoxy-D-manno-octulosonic-acid transferase
MPLLYSASVGLYHAAVRFAALWDPKARAWVKGREHFWQRLSERREALQGCLWMHCASVGEFEQGRPVLEAIKAQRPELPVLITFFSPSGYEARKDYALATHVDYLPPDATANAKRLVDMVVPRAAIFVKYEFWYHHLHALKAKAVPTFLVSALFRKSQPFFRWYGGAWREMLRCYTRIFTQDEPSRALLGSIGVAHVTVGGDTRFDRVMAIVNALRSTDTDEVERDMERRMFLFRNGWPKPILVLGSTWEKDVALLAAARSVSSTAFRCVVVPHELKEEDIAFTQKLLKRPSCRWSKTDMEQYAWARDGDLIVDAMGLLSRLYPYGEIAYVGGGFGDGIHSLLEAAAWGKPVIFGPNHRKFPEAQGLIDAGGGFEVRNAEELREVLDRLMGDKDALAKAGEAAGKYVRDRVGATERTVASILRIVD